MDWYGVTAPGSAGSGGVEAARRMADAAAGLLAAAAPHDWRSVSARAFTARLDGLARRCRRLVHDVAQAAALVRLLEVELAVGMRVLCPASPTVLHGYGPTGGSVRYVPVHTPGMPLRGTGWQR